MSVNQDKLNEQLLNVVLSDKDDVEAKFKKIKYLVKLGADVNANIFGKSILSKVKHADNVKEEVREFLKSIGAKEYVCSKDKAEELGRGFWDENGKVKSLDEIKKSVRDGANLGVFSVKGQQIWKYLSSDEIDELLKILPKGYEIDGGVYLNKMKMTKLPDFSKIKVKGDFECSDNMLSSLEGAPLEVGGDFFCSQCGLKSLIGMPLEVGRSFSCYGNDLSSLEGGPKKVGQNFHCGGNKLQDLCGAPDKILGNFNCSHNELKTLKGAPLEVGGEFRCGYNELQTLEGAPKKVGIHFICYYNKLTSLKGAPLEVLGEFDCSHNELSDLVGAPLVVGSFDCKNNILTSLKGAPKKVKKYFTCTENPLESLEGKPLEIGGEFFIEDEVLEYIKKREKKAKGKEEFNKAFKGVKSLLSNIWEKGR